MLQVTAANYDETARDNPLIFIVFGAPWCGPCKAYSRNLTAFEAQMPIPFGKVCVDDEAPLARRFGITSVPTTLLIKDGHVVASQTGILTQAVLTRMLNG